MGLAERFKEKLEKRNIFTNNAMTSPISTIHENKIEVEPEAEDVTNKTEIIEPTENILNSNDAISERYEFEDIETQVIDKIRKTPYWSEFSIQRQEKMISSYLDKINSKGKEITPYQLKELVKNIIILSNH